ncbi:MAG: LicD family protein [Erysipelotrichaceae bacterium]|nr:LicD family protein [Erysipelotrichaceae bacterium]
MHQEYIIKNNSEGIITVRDVQMAIHSMTKDIIALCDEYKITYWLIGGSALGAYRHQGYIPWDDDFDLAMMREDYLRFITILDKHLDQDKYVYHCYEKNKAYNVLIPAMKIRKKGTYIEETNSLLKNKIDDCNGIFIDVFVYDYVNENRIIDFFPRLLNYLLMPIIVFFENMGINPIFIKNLFVNNAHQYGIKNRNSSLIGLDLCWTFRSIFKPYIYRKDDIFPVKKMTFEDTEFCCPKNIEQFLEIEIGPNYRELPDEKHRFAKHTKDIKL